jgi:trehalose 6-phosphate synthase
MERMYEGNPNGNGRRSLGLGARLIDAFRRPKRETKHLRIVIVSNRLPVLIEAKNGGPHVRAASGGLVTALGPLLRRRGGLWIGWPGAAGVDEPTLNGLLADHSRQVGYDLLPVPMSNEEIDGFYQGYCNEIIWPLFHDLQSQCNFVPDYWTQYTLVKQKFAEVVQRNVQDGDFVWVQDYHLMGLGRQLRERGLGNGLGFFLHIPFPPPDIFCKLPWRHEVLESLTDYAVLGFQAPRDRENFLDCVRKLLPTARLRTWRKIVECRFEGRVTQIGTFPIGIDYELFAGAAATPTITDRVKELRRQIPTPQIVLGLDRLDYTKGIPYRLRAFHLALKRYPELHRKITLLQVVVPSRETVPEYQDLKAQIERLVTQINGEFTQPGWVPIHHVFRSLEWDELISYYRVADVGLVTPLKDGMNLVSKEYCACQVEGDGVLILSEFAGAAVQLARGAILVNPYDLDRVADSIRTAVGMTPEQRGPSMQRLRRIVRRQNVYWWADRFLGACGIPETCAQRQGTDPGASVPFVALSH